MVVLPRQVCEWPDPQQPQALRVGHSAGQNVVRANNAWRLDNDAVGNGALHRSRDVYGERVSVGKQLTTARLSPFIRRESLRQAWRLAFVSAIATECARAAAGAGMRVIAAKAFHQLVAKLCVKVSLLACNAFSTPMRARISASVRSSAFATMARWQLIRSISRSWPSSSAVQVRIGTNVHTGVQFQVRNPASGARTYRSRPGWLAFGGTTMAPALG
jgi:hypothetical protein